METTLTRIDSVNNSQQTNTKNKLASGLVTLRRGLTIRRDDEPHKKL